jgi:endonuclease YncB( thermonuclease family)
MTRKTENLFLLTLLLVGWWIFPWASRWTFKAYSKNSQTTHSAAPKIIWSELFFKDCHDGDTCTVQTQEGIQLTLRLVGIDAPEVAKSRGPKKNRHQGQTFGKESREYLLKKVKGRTLPVQLLGSDTYKRYLAIIFERDEQGQKKPTSLNQELIEQGYSFAYTPQKTATQNRLFKSQLEKTPEWALKAEKTAKQNKKGLWALKEPPENPSEFRKRNR